MRTLLRTLLTATAVAALASAAFAQEADLIVEKTGPATAAEDTDVSYSVTLTNLGLDDAVSVLLSDPVPMIFVDMVPYSMTFVSATVDSGPGFSCALVVNTVECTGPLLAAGTAAEFTIVFHMPSGVPPGTTFSNVATASAATPDPNEENNSGAAVTSTPSPGQADIAVAKTGPDRAGPGEDVVYTITFGNGGPNAATDAEWTDVLPGDMTFVSVMQQSGPAMSCTAPAQGDNGTVTCTAASFPAGATATFTLTGHIPPATPVGTTYENTVAGSSKTPDPNGENNAGVTTVQASAVDVSVEKTGNTTATAGTDLAYTIGVENTGQNDATGVTLVDPLPPGTTFVSLTQNNGPLAVCETPDPGTNGDVACEMFSLPAGTSAQFTLVVRIGDTLQITNTVTVAAAEFDVDNSNNTSELTTTISPRADRGVVKTGPSSVVAGETVNYLITVMNNGPSTATTFSLIDTLPANTSFVSINQTSGPAFNCGFASGTITCNIASLAPGATANFSVVLEVSPSAPSGSTIANTATVTAATPDDIGGNNSSTTQNATVTTSADLSVAKAGPAAAGAGLNITYTVTASNLGPSDAANVVLTDTLPANTTFVSSDQLSGPAFNCVEPPSGGTGAVTCTATSFALDAVAVFEIVVQVSPAAANGTMITNSASIAASTPDPVTTNNNVTLPSTVAAVANLNLSKSGPASVAAGDDANYVITLTNTGPADATNVAVTENPPPQTTLVSFTQTSGPAFTCGGTSCMIATFAVNATATFAVVLEVSPTAEGTITNSATATATTADPTTPNNASSAPATVTPGTTDLSIVKRAENPRIAPGSEAIFTIVVTNNGPAIAYDVVVTDILPPGATLGSATPTQGSCAGTSTVICSLGTLQPSGTATITLVVTVSAAGGNFSNTATVSAANADSNALNNTSIGALFGAFDAPLSPLALTALALMLGMAGWFVLRR